MPAGWVPGGNDSLNTITTRAGVGVRCRAPVDLRPTQKQFLAAAYLHARTPFSACNCMMPLTLAVVRPPLTLKLPLYSVPCPSL